MRLVVKRSSYKGNCEVTFYYKNWKKLLLQIVENVSIGIKYLVFLLR